MNLIEAVDQVRLEASSGLDASARAELGQFFTPAAVARLMASMIRGNPDVVRILEPGAGTGSLVAAAVEQLTSRAERPTQISVLAYEVDPDLVVRLKHTLELCSERCALAGVSFDAEVVTGDFVEAAVEDLRPSLFARDERALFDLVIANPPYRKIRSDSRHRRLLAMAGIETTNLYSAFVALAVKKLSSDGELIAITPRSFCNGTYFKKFRQWLLSSVHLTRIHIFESRREAFRDADVLQENIIWRGSRAGAPSRVSVTTSNGSAEHICSTLSVPYDEVVWPGDRRRVIHIVQDAESREIANVVRGLPCQLSDLDVAVSTGRVVDFRVKAHLRPDADDDCRPLIYPAHFDSGFVRWPVDSRKPNALAVGEATEDQWVPNGVYVLTKRFTSKEERRRIVATVYDPNRVADLREYDAVGFENHLNYFHRAGRGLPLRFAKGLALFLNSTLVDRFFRQFSGHTQVNAADLRMLRYPSAEQIDCLGAAVQEQFPDQVEIDQLLRRALATNLSR